MSGTIRVGSTVVIAAVGLAGCGSTHKASPPRSQTVVQVLRSYLRAQVAGDGETACSLLTTGAQQRLVTLVQQAAGGTLTTRPSCQDAVALVAAVAGAKLLDALASARIAHVKVQGTDATAELLDGTAFGQQQVSLKRLDGAWRISGVPSLSG
jgi:hypothetical protein